MENKIAGSARSTGPARVLIPLGVGLIVFGLVMMLFIGGGEYVEAVGKVTQVTEGVNAENHRVYDVSFTYSVDGREYEGFFSELPEEYQVGGEIRFYYSAEEPSKVLSSKLGGVVAPVMLGLGALALAFGVFTAVKARKPKAQDQTAFTVSES